MKRFFIVKIIFLLILTVVVSGCFKVQDFTTPVSTYKELKLAMSDDDLEATIRCFTEGAQDKYRSIFSTNENKLLDMAKGLGNIEESYTYDNIAKYKFHRQQNGKEYTYYVYFMKDQNNNWKIDSL